MDGIREWLRGLAEARAPGLLGILEGEGGQGQSDSLAALGEACEELGIRVLSSRASRGAAFPAALLSDLFCQWAQRAAGPAKPSPPLSEDVAALVGKVARHPFFGPPRSQPSLGHDLDRDRLLDGLARGFIEIGIREPTLIVLEDLQWADAFTLEVLRRLLWMSRLRRRRGASPRILVIASVAAGTDLQELLGYCDLTVQEIEAFRIVPRGYSRDDVRDLASRVLSSECPLSVRERVLRLTHGNVRHIRWVFWHGFERGGLVGVADADLGFTKLVRARFARLEEIDQGLVAVLSALDRPIDASLLESLCAPVKGSDSPAGEAAPGAVAADGPPATGMLSRLETLCSRSWLIRCDGSRPHPATGEVPPQGPRFYAIADSDIAGIVLEGLNEARRREVHATLGKELLRLASEEESWLPHAARHFRLASVPAQGEHHAVVMKAASFLETLGCASQALELVESFLAQAERDGLKAGSDMLLRQAELLRLLGFQREAIDLHSRLLSTAMSAEDRGAFQRRLGDLHGELGEIEQQKEQYREGLRLLAAGSTSAERLKLQAALSRVHVEEGELEESLRGLDECLQAIATRELTSATDHVDVYRLAEEVHFRRGDFAEAAEFERCLLKRCEESADIAGQLRSLRHLSHLHASRAEREEAEVYLLEALRLAKATGSRWLTARALCCLGSFQRDLRDRQGALDHCRQAAAVLWDLHQVEPARRIQAITLGLEFELGRFDELGRRAPSVLKDLACLTPSPGKDGLEAVSLDEGDGDALHGEVLDRERRRERIRELEGAAALGGSGSRRAEVLLLLARCLEDEGRLDDAFRVYQSCLRPECGADSPGRSRAALSLGRIAAARGDFDGALWNLEQALNLQGKKPCREALAMTYLELSSIYLERGELAHAFDACSRGVRLMLEYGGFCGIFEAFLEVARFLCQTGFALPSCQIADALAELGLDAEVPRLELTARRLSYQASLALHGQGTPPVLPARLESLASTLDMPLENCRMKLLQGWSAYRAGSFGGALQAAREGLEIARALGLEPLLEQLLHLVGAIEAAARNPRKNFLRAIEALEQALAGAEARRSCRLAWEILRDLADVYRDRGKSDLADAYERRAQEIDFLVFGKLPPELTSVRWHSPEPVGVDV